MRHKKKGRKFGRERNQRKALFQGLLSNLILAEKIQTTEAKAKEIKGKIDRVINKAKKLQNPKFTLQAVKRELRKELPLVACRKITGEFLNKFSGRGSGYCRVIKLAPRKSDGAKMAVIEFV